MRYLLAFLLLFSSTIYAGWEPMHIALLKHMHPQSSEESKEYQLNKTRDRAYAMELYLRKMSHYQWGEIKVRAFLLVSDCTPDYPYYCKTVIDDMLDEIITEDFNPWYFNIWASYAVKGMCGQAGLNDRWSVTYAGCTVGTNIHEHFHNMGLHHGMKNGSEYGDSTSIMGHASTLTGLNSPQLITLDLNKTEPVEVTTSQEVLLVPVELLPASLHDQEIQHLIVEDHHLSTRKYRGFPYKARNVREGDVFIHLRQSDAPNMYKNKTDWIETLKLNESIQIGNATVTYLEYKNETSRLSIEINGEIVSNTATIIDTLPELVVPVDTIHNGLWYTKDFTGQGFDIQVKGDRMVIMWYTFNESNAAPRFYIASGSRFANELHLQTTNSLNALYAGTIQAHFFDDTTGVINYNTPEHGRGSAYITLLSHDEDPQSGLFIEQDVPLEGFSARFRSDGATMFWFTHGYKPWNIVSTNSIVHQRWFMLSGPKEKDEYTFNVYEVTGGKFLMFNTTDVEKVGTAILDADMNLTLTLDADSMPAYENHIFPLYRLF